MHPNNSARPFVGQLSRRSGARDRDTGSTGRCHRIPRTCRPTTVPPRDMTSMPRRPLPRRIPGNEHRFSLLRTGLSLS
jgi:hypothetical protein